MVEKESEVRRWLVDITRWRPSLAQFHAAAALLPSHDRAAITRYWCLKEAFVKAIGAGVGFGLHRLEFHHVDWSNIFIRIDGEESKIWRFSLFKLDEMHLASVAKGYPEDAINSYKKTLPNVIIEEEQLHAILGTPEEPFTLWTVEQHTELQD